jgi:hypothetical protein
MLYRAIHAPSNALSSLKKGIQGSPCNVDILHFSINNHVFQILKTVNSKPSNYHTMQTKIKPFSTLLLLFSFLSAASVQAQELDAKTENKRTLSIETDPSTFAFKGYALHFRFKPKSSQRLLIGAGTYGMDMPNFLVNMNSENKDIGWKVRINSAFSLFGEYYFKTANKGIFVGLQAGIQNYKIMNINKPDLESRYNNLLIMPSIGYNWQPFGFPLYVKPWLGIGYTRVISGDNEIDDQTYDVSPISPFVTVHVGYTFRK